MKRPPTHPGEMLRAEFLEPYGMTQRELATRLGVSYVRVNELVKGRRGMTADTALRLERVFGMEAAFWLNVQMQHDLYHARRALGTSLEHIEVFRMPATRPIPANSSTDSESVNHVRS